MFEHYPWQPVPAAQVQAYLRLIKPLPGGLRAHPGSARMQRCVLPFYQTFLLAGLDDSSWPAGTGPFWFLAQHARLFPLDGNSAPIHAVNDAEPIRVTEANCLEYLRFFCYFVHGGEGPFLIIEDISHAAVDSGRLTPDKRQVIVDSLRPTLVEGRTEEGALRVSATVLYGTSLFSARFAMSEDGGITMTEDEPLATDVPVRKAVPASWPVPRSGEE